MLQEMQCLLDQFKEIYQNKLSAVENNAAMTNEEILQMKLDILEEYITDLAEQNLNLIQASALLQTEAEARVDILEKLLDKTADNSHDYVYSINKFQQLKFEESVNKLEKSEIEEVQSRIKDLEEERNSLQEHSVYLTRKISNLIQVISHARNTRCWDFTNTEIGLDDLDLFTPIDKSSPREFSYSEEFNFKDISRSRCDEQGKSIVDLTSPLHQATPSVISFNCSYTRGSCAHITDKDVLIKHLQVDVKILDKKNNDKNTQLLLKDATIASLQSEITQLRHELTLKENECALHLHGLQVKSDKQQEEIIRRLKNQIDVEKMSYKSSGISSSTQTEERVMSQTKSTATESEEFGVGQLGQKIELMVGNEEEKNRRLENKFQIKLREATEKVEKYKQKVGKLKEEIQMLDISAQETRLILTHEIAEKHDTIKVLRHELMEQADHHKEIVQQLVLKSEVIKGLRKDLKHSEHNIESREFEVTKQNEELISQQQLLEKQATEIENQKITIANLQEALVQTKRNPNNFSNGVTNGSSTKQKSSITMV
uniref:Uncharacterized protein n=1 Tax=Strigamia maritima TaxID=126957 RepID=T1J2N7_STRMM